MKKLYLLFSHTLTKEQIEDAKKSLGVKEFVKLPHELQKLWSNIPPEIEDLSLYLEPIKVYLAQNLKPNDIALVQGDFGATCKIVKSVKKLNSVAVYATTTRKVIEKNIEEKIVKTSIFQHVRFRKYE